MSCQEAMPQKPKKPCSFSGCPNLTQARFCDEHKKFYQSYEVSGRRDKLKFYDTPFWKRTRNRILKAEPLCRSCKKHDVITAAVLVDHIIPIEQGGAAYSFENLQPMCSLCHQKKRAFEAGLAAKGLTYKDLK